MKASRKTKKQLRKLRAQLEQYNIYGFIPAILLATWFLFMMAR